MKHADTYCHICKTSEYTLFDEFHGEIFCTNCGSVVHETYTHKSTVKQITETKIKEKKRYDYLKMKIS